MIEIKKIVVLLTIKKFERNDHKNWKVHYFNKISPEKLIFFSLFFCFSSTAIFAFFIACSRSGSVPKKEQLLTRTCEPENKKIWKKNC